MGLAPILRYAIRLIPVVVKTMQFSDFGKHFSGNSGITTLMEDLSEGLSREGMIMMGGGNPAKIPEVQVTLRETLDRLYQSGELLQALANYDGPQGNTAFLETLAAFFQEQFGWSITAKNLALTHGSQSAFFVLFNTFAGHLGNRNRKVLLPLVPEYIGYSDVGIEDDMFISHEARIEMLDGGLFKYLVDFEHIEIDDSIGVICVSRPTNPSGNVLTDDECQHLDSIARQADVPLVIDNAYGTPFPNIIFSDVKPFWNDNTIVCMSLSKLGLPGARTGILIANEELIRYFTNMTAISSLAPSGLGATITRQLIQDGTLLPLCEDVIKPFYKRRLQFAIDALQAHISDPRLHIHKPEGALFLWLWIEDLPISSEDLYRRLKDKGLVVVPGKYFFPGQSELSKHADSCIRVSVVADEESVSRGMQLLADELNLLWGWN